MLLNSSARIPGTLSARRSLAPPPVHRPSWPRIIACVIRTGFSRPLDALSRRGSGKCSHRVHGYASAWVWGTCVSALPLLFNTQHCIFTVVTHFKPDERPEAELQGTHVAKGENSRTRPGPCTELQIIRYHTLWSRQKFSCHDLSLMGWFCRPRSSF